MPAPVYVPSVGEVMVALFVLGLAVGCYGLAVRLLPLERVGASEGEARLESAYADAGADAVRAVPARRAMRFRRARRCAMEVQRKDEAQERAGMFGTPSRRAVVGAGCAVARARCVAREPDWGLTWQPTIR